MDIVPERSLIRSFAGAGSYERFAKFFPSLIDQALKPHNENQQATKRPQVNPSPKQAVCNSANEALAVRSHAGQVLQHANTTTMTDNDQQESGQGPSNRVVSVIMLVQSPINPPLQESWLHSVIPLQEQVTPPSHSQQFFKSAREGKAIFK